MKLTKISVWSTAFVVALVYTILNAIMLTVVSLISLFSGAASSALGASASVPTSASQWLIYLGMSFAIAFIVTALSVLIFNLLAKVFAVHISLEESRPKPKRK